MGRARRCSGAGRRPRRPLKLREDGARKSDDCHHERRCRPDGAHHRRCRGLSPGGRVAVRAREVSGDALLFDVPAAAVAIRICSRSAVPAQTGLTSDLRRLGVFVTRIVVTARGLRLDLSPSHQVLVMAGTCRRARHAGRTAPRCCRRRCSSGLARNSRSRFMCRRRRCATRWRLRRSLHRPRGCGTRRGMPPAAAWRCS